MTDDFFSSSDTGRSGAPLAHAKTVTLDGPLDLERGGRLTRVDVAYETYGTLNAARSNAVLICHALTGDSHVARHDDDDDPGWWDLAVGPGKAIDTDRYFVICPNHLGGCRGTTGPSSTNPATGKPFGGAFPEITILDMVEVQRRLLDALGIERLLAVTGASMGGQITLGWGARYPERIRGAAAIATAPRLSSLGVGFDVVGRTAIRRDPAFRGGDYGAHDEAPDTGLALARMIGHITYLSRASMAKKFDAHRAEPRPVLEDEERRFSVGSYLAYKGFEFVKRFEANTYDRLSMAMDLFDLGGDPETVGAHLAEDDVRWLAVSFTGDWLFPTADSRLLVEALTRSGKRVSHVNIESEAGHDAFLLPLELDRYGGVLSGFLDSLLNEAKGAETISEKPPESEIEGETGDGATNPTSPDGAEAARIRGDLLALVEEGESTLLLACGTGEDLAAFTATPNRHVAAVEAVESAAIAAVGRGLDVIHDDPVNGAARFPVGAFDVAVSFEPLHIVEDVTELLDALLRVGRAAVVGFEIRGRASQPVESGANRQDRDRDFFGPAGRIRPMTVPGFEAFLDTLGIRIAKRELRESAGGPSATEDLVCRAAYRITR